MGMEIKYIVKRHKKGQSPIEEGTGQRKWMDLKLKTSMRMMIDRKINDVKINKG